jgi:hypothetical protein
MLDSAINQVLRLRVSENRPDLKACSAKWKMTQDSESKKNSSGSGSGISGYEVGY